MSCRHPGHKGKVGHIAGDDCAGTDEGMGSDGQATDDGTVRSQGRAPTDPGVAILIFALDQGPGVIDIGKNHAGTTEYALFEGDVVIDRDIVLDLAAVPDDDAVPDKDVLAEGHAPVYDGAGTDMGRLPDTGSIADLGTVVDDGARVPELICHALFPKNGW